MCRSNYGVPLFEIALVLVRLDHVARFKATKEINMQHLILLAVVSMMVLYMLTIVACLFYIGRHGRRNVLNHPART